MVPLLLVALGCLLMIPSCAEFIAERLPQPYGANTLGLRSAPWVDGERVEYRVVDSLDRYLGRAGFTFAKDGGDWVLNHTSETARLEEHYTMKLEGWSLKPISQVKSIATPEGSIKLSTRYIGGKVEVSASTRPSGSRDGNTITLATSIPTDAYDNDQLPMSLRSLPFETGYTAQYTNIISGTLRTPTTITVKGKETVKTPAGTFESWRVVADFGKVSHYLWYQVEAPHHLVKYDNGDAKLVLSAISP